jgi:hypothetical protein
LWAMVVVKYLANPPTCAFGYFACSLGSANADVFAGADCALSDISGCVDGVEGDEIACSLPDSFGSGSCAPGCSFADVSCPATDVAAGAALFGLWLSLRLGLGLSGRLGCVGRWRRGLRLAVLASSALNADRKG